MVSSGSALGRPVMIIASDVSSNRAYTRRVNTANLIAEILAMYQRHGWTVREALLRPDTRTAIGSVDSLDNVQVRESDFDALWFARPSHAKREAWELRLISEQAYALFEAFEADEGEDAREEARREMENRMREHVAGA